MPFEIRALADVHAAACLTGPQIRAIGRAAYKLARHRPGWGTGHTFYETVQSHGRGHIVVVECRTDGVRATVYLAEWFHLVGDQPWPEAA